MSRQGNAKWDPACTQKRKGKEKKNNGIYYDTIIRKEIASPNHFNYPKSVWWTTSLSTINIVSLPEIWERACWC
jgi:hypothetical protein